MIRAKLIEPTEEFIKAGKEELRRYRAFLKASKASKKTKLVKAKASKSKSGKASKKSFKFKVYGSAREKLLEIFKGKCSYCEGPIESNQPGDVEHYRPKGGVLIGKDLKPGYYWLAAAWDNLLISCNDCNRQRKQLIKGIGRINAGKLNQFPLADEKRRAKRPKDVEKEVPLLINPYKENPEKLLVFILDEDNDVLVKPARKKGLIKLKAEKSIEVYALQRSGLVSGRSKLARNILMDMAAILKIKCRLEREPSNKALEESLIEGIELMTAKYLELDQPYTAMARCLISPFVARIAGINQP
jgi:uncharacterized protein (TIGR02646 family)